MNEITKILLTSFLTILGGVIVYTVGQIISKFFIEPIHHQGEIIGEIADALIYHARAYGSPGFLEKEYLDKASGRFRQLASLLRSRSYMIRWYGVFKSLKLVPSLNEVEGASKELIGLSNSLHDKQTDEGITKNYERVNKIRKLLGIPVSD